MIFFVSSFAKGRQLFYNSTKFDLFTIKIRTNTDAKAGFRHKKKSTVMVDFVIGVTL